jgi:hypothetical protein
VKNLDGAYEGIEVKSGTSKDTSQESFDNGASYDKPAYATLRGECIKTISVAHEHVEERTLILTKTNGSVGSVLKDTFHPLPE